MGTLMELQLFALDSLKQSSKMDLPFKSHAIAVTVGTLLPYIPSYMHACMHAYIHKYIHTYIHISKRNNKI